MGTIVKKSFTKPLPAGAIVTSKGGKRVASWLVGGKSRTAPVTTGKDGQPRLALKSSKYTAKFTDASGRLREVATGCRDATAAQQVLARLQQRADQVRSGMKTAAEDASLDYRRTPLAGNFDAYLAWLESEDTSPVHRKNVRRCLDRIALEAPFGTVRDIDREVFARWMLDRKAGDMGARTRNIHRAALMAFCNWAVEFGRMLANPVAKVATADESSDSRRKRRAMTDGELGRLLEVARGRPLMEALTVRRGKNKGQAVANVRESVRQRLELLGHERALIYKTLVLTGLRKGELASLTVGQVELDSVPPLIQLDAADEKNREGNAVPLRADLVQDLRAWLAHKRANGKLPLEELLFDVPTGLIRILDRDLKAAGIAKRDERGRTLDVHALRTSFVTLLSKGGVAPRTAQAAARHSDLALTMGVYTDPKLLDVHGALAALPSLPIVELAPWLAPKVGPTRQDMASAVNLAVQAASRECGGFIAVSDEPVNENTPLSFADNGVQEERANGLEPSTSSLGS